MMRDLFVNAPIKQQLPLQHLNFDCSSLGLTAFSRASSHQSMNKKGSPAVFRCQWPGPLLFSISAVRWKSSGKIGCWPTRRNQYLALEESDSIRWMMPCQ